MPKTNNDSYQTISAEFYQKAQAGLGANGPLALAKSALVLPTQPLQVTLRAQQSAVKGSLRPLGMFATMRQLYTQDGLRAFFKGVTPAGLKEGGKYLTYKTPLLKGAPSIIDAAWPTSFNNLPLSLHSPLKALLAGGFAASCDTAFGGGLEAYATYRSTAQGQFAKANFGDELRAIPSLSGKIKRVYQGSLPATLKGTLGFTTFFAASAPIKQAAREFYGVEGPTPWYVTATAAVSTGAIVAATSSPLDIAKTLAQMPNATEKGVAQVIKENAKRHGVRGLSAGVGTKAIMVATGWTANFIFTQNVLANDEPHCSPKM